VVRGLEAGEIVATSGSFLIDAETRLNPAAGSTYFGASGGPPGRGARRSGASTSRSASDEAATVSANLARLSPEDRRLAEAQRFCPVQEDNRLGSMGPPVKVMVQERPVFLCCKACEKEARDHADQTLATLQKLKSRARETPTGE
jgi:membrane fusion protein, copper/silver efflux system